MSTPPIPQCDEWSIILHTAPKFGDNRFEHVEELSLESDDGRQVKKRFGARRNFELVHDLLSIPRPYEKASRSLDYADQQSTRCRVPGEF